MIITTTCLIDPHNGSDYGCTKPGGNAHTDAADSAAHRYIPEHVVLAISKTEKINGGKREIACET
jgi:hypothetical protein